MRLIVVVLSTVVIFPCVVFGPEKVSGTSSRAEQAVQQAGANFLRAFNDLEWDTFQGVFADDATIFFPWGGLRENWMKNGRARFKSMFDAIRERDKAKGPPYLRITPGDMKIQTIGDVAIMTFHLGEDGQSRRTIVWQKRHGKWLILHLHASNIKLTKSAEQQNTP